MSAKKFRSDDPAVEDRSFLKVHLDLIFVKMFLPKFDSIKNLIFPQPSIEKEELKSQTFEEDESSEDYCDYEYEIQETSKKIESDLNNIDFVLKRCKALVGLKKYELAKIDAEKIIALDSSRSDGYLLAARCSQALGDLPAASAMVQRLQEMQLKDHSFKLDQIEFEEVLNFRDLVDDVEATFDQKMFRECLDAISRLQKVSHADVDRYRLMRAKCHFHLEEFEEAKEILVKIVKYDPKNIEATFILGNCYYHEGNLTESIGTYESILKLHSDQRVFKQNEKVKKVRDLMFLGNEYYQRKKYRKSIKKFSQALDLEKQNKAVAAANFNNRAMALKKTRFFKSAVEDFNEAFKMNPSDKSIHSKRAYPLYKIGRYIEAITDCEEALKLGCSKDYQKLKLKAEKKLRNLSIRPISSRYKKFSQPTLHYEATSYCESTRTSSLNIHLQDTVSASGNNEFYGSVSGTLRSRSRGK